VVAGTAGAVRHRQDQRYANQAAQQQTAAEQQAYDQQMAAQQAAAAPSGGIDMDQLKQLGDLHSSGVLSDEEFAAAKAKLLGNA
jgi:hypothetical protein